MNCLLKIKLFGLNINDNNGGSTATTIEPPAEAIETPFLGVIGIIFNNIIEIKWNYFILK